LILTDLSVFFQNKAQPLRTVNQSSYFGKIACVFYFWVNALMRLAMLVPVDTLHATYLRGNVSMDNVSMDEISTDYINAIRQLLIITIPCTCFGVIN